MSHVNLVNNLQYGRRQLLSSHCWFARFVYLAELPKTELWGERGARQQEYQKALRRSESWVQLLGF